MAPPSDARRGVMYRGISTYWTCDAGLAGATSGDSGEYLPRFSRFCLGARQLVAIIGFQRRVGQHRRFTLSH